MKELNSNRTKEMKREEAGNDCYFCTDSEKFEVSSILKAYETQMICLPMKGRLCPLHIQIVPYDHIGSYSIAENDVLEELKKIKKEIIEKYALKHGQHDGCLRVVYDFI